jgi:hypothetical protein
MSAKTFVKNIKGRTTRKNFDHCKDACSFAGKKFNSDKVEAVRVVASHEDSPEIVIMDFSKVVPSSEWVRPVRPA